MNSPKLTYIKGNITKPIEDSCVIAHIVNDIGLMGSGVAKALYEKWLIVKTSYLNWHSTNYKSNSQSDYCYFQLGETQFVLVEEIQTNFDGIDYKIVANMIAQHSIISKGEKKPIRYDALDKCLKEVYSRCLKIGMNLHMPKIGSGLAQGDWNEIEKIILSNIKVDTFIYEYQE